MFGNDTIWNRTFRFTSFLVSLALVLSMAACQQGGARGGGGGGGAAAEDETGQEGAAGENAENNEAGNNDSPAAVVATGQVVGELNGLFDPGQPWYLFHEGGLITGFGNRTEIGVVLAAPGYASNCIAVDPAVSLSVENGRLTLDTQFTEIADGRLCSTTFTSDSPACGEGGTFPVAMACELSNLSGVVSQTGVQDGFQGDLPVANAAIARLETCDVSSIRLGRPLSAWGVMNVNPLAVAFADDPASLGGLVIVSVDPSTSLGLILTRLQEDGFFGGCGTENLDPNVRIEGDRLIVDISFTNDASAGARNCAIQFEGQVVYCAQLDPASLGQSGEPTRIARFEGSGFWSADEERGDLPALYAVDGPVDVPLRR